MACEKRLSPAHDGFAHHLGLGTLFCFAMVLGRQG